MYASKYSHEFEESCGFGWNYEVEPKFDWSTLIANKNAELQRLTGIYKNILKNAGVTLIEGRGKVGKCTILLSCSVRLQVKAYYLVFDLSGCGSSYGGCGWKTLLG